MRFTNNGVLWVPKEEKLEPKKEELKAPTEWNCQHCGRYYNSETMSTWEYTVGGITLPGEHPKIGHLVCPGCQKCMRCKHE